MTAPSAFELLLFGAAYACDVLAAYALVMALLAFTALVLHAVRSAWDRSQQRARQNIWQRALRHSVRRVA